MQAIWPWLLLAGLGAFHGLNPAMGWLFAVALGMHRKSLNAVLAALPPIALGHAVSIALVAGGAIAATFDERDDAVKAMLGMAIAACRERGAYVGICGQGPSDHPDLAQWLVEQGIGSISLNPDTVVSTWMLLAGKPEVR